MSGEGVARELLAYGRELETLGVAQVDAGFTPSADANQLIEGSPNAFLFGVLFTQGIPAERAWAGPFLLQVRLGSLEPSFLAAHPETVRSAFQQAPMLHRFKEMLPRWIVSAARKLVTDYASDAARIWPVGDHVVDVTERLCGFDGIGRKKAVMAVEILTRHFGVDLVGRECSQVAYDVHVRRVFLRSGLIDADAREAIEDAARRACPEAPGTLDLPAWLVGRETCRPRRPLCDECRLGMVCPRLTGRQVEGVGVRKKSQGLAFYSAERNTSPESSLG